MNLKVMIVKKRRCILPAIAAAALIVGGAIYLCLGGSDPPGDRQVGKSPSSRMRIEGLRFYGMNQERRVVSIEADRFTLGKGKIGFFSTGLTRKAAIENAAIDLYAGAPSAPEPGPGQQDGGAPLPGGARSNAPPRPGSLRAPDFNGLFAEETFSSLFPVRNIAEIEVYPVKVRLHDDRDLLMQIIADRATVRLREKAVLFSGRVRVSARGAEMTAEQAVFVPETSRLRVDGPFVLRQGPRTLEGSGLTTDLLLHPQ